MKKLDFKLLMIPVFALSFSVIVISCGGDEKVESKSMSQIQNEEGVPVHVKKIEKELLVKELGFFSRLRGIKETTEGAKIGGRVEKINYKVGDVVKKGAVVVEFPVDAPGAMYEQAKTAYENSLKNYERAKVLLEAGETATANFDAAEAKYLVDKSNYETQKQLIFIEAPYDGVITEIKVNEKDNVQDKTPLFSIAQLNKVTAKVLANEDEIKLIKKGMPAFIENGGKNFEGKVVEVSISADPKTQSFYAETEFVNSGMLLKSGVTADIKIRVYENKNAVVIPRNIIKEDASGKYIFTVENGNSVKKYIRTGYESDLNVEVTGGIEAGETLIVKGSANMSGGEKIKVIQ